MERPRPAPGTKHELLPPLTVRFPAAHDAAHRRACPERRRPLPTTQPVRRPLSEPEQPLPLPPRLAARRDGDGGGDGHGDVPGRGRRHATQHEPQQRHVPVPRRDALPRLPAAAPAPTIGPLDALRRRAPAADAPHRARPEPVWPLVRWVHADAHVRGRVVVLWAAAPHAATAAPAIAVADVPAVTFADVPAVPTAVAHVPEPVARNRDGNGRRCGDGPADDAAAADVDGREPIRAERDAAAAAPIGGGRVVRLAVRKLAVTRAVYAATAATASADVRPAEHGHGHGRGHGHGDGHGRDAGCTGGRDAERGGVCRGGMGPAAAAATAGVRWAAAVGRDVSV